MQPEQKHSDIASNLIYRIQQSEGKGDGKGKIMLK